MNLHNLLASRLISRVVASDRGRAFVLSQAAAAEGSDEGRIFDELLSRVDDDELARLVRIHQADEERHAEMFTEAAQRIGAAPPANPPELDLLARLDRALGGFFEHFSDTPGKVMEAYLILQVIEERAVHQFGLLEPALRRVDVHAADAVASIARDEIRHLKYCRAIARRYAPDEATRKATLARFRKVEAQSFGEHSRANMRFFLENDLAVLGPVERWMWEGLLRIGDRRADPVPTRFTAEPA